MVAAACRWARVVSWSGGSERAQAGRHPSAHAASTACPPPHLDLGVGVADGAAIMGGDVGHAALAKLQALDLAQLERSLLGVNAHGHEAALEIVQDAEVLASLGDGNDVHHAERVSGIATDLVVHSDVARLVSADFDSLLAGESVFQSVAEQDRQGNALSKLVGSSRGTGGVNTSKFVQTPVRWCPHALHMLLWSSCL